MKATILLALMIPMISFGQLNPTSCGTLTLGHLKAEVHGDTVILKNDTVMRTCDSKYEMLVTGSLNDTIKWMQHDTGSPNVYCVCNYNLSVTIDSLKPGNYYASVYFSYISGYVCHIGTIPFTVVKPSTFQDYSVINESQSQCFPVGINESNDYSANKEMAVYPNPVKDFLTINSISLQEVNIHLIDLKSNCTMKVQLREKENQIDLRSIPNGLYCLSIESNRKITHFKILKY